MKKLLLLFALLPCAVFGQNVFVTNSATKAVNVILRDESGNYVAQADILQNPFERTPKQRRRYDLDELMQVQGGNVFVTNSATKAVNVILRDTAGAYVDASGGGGGTISDTAYNAGTWDAVTTIAPSKNAVRDKIEALVPLNGALGTPTSGTLADSLTYTHDLTAAPNQTGGWSEYYVTGSNATNATTGLVDITGMASGTLSVSTKYEIEVVIDASTSADTTGLKYAISCTGGGTAAVVQVYVASSSTSTTAVGQYGLAAPDTGGTTVMTASAQTGQTVMKGWVTTRSTGTPVISIQHQKVTSGTSTVKVGSIMRIRKART